MVNYQGISLPKKILDLIEKTIEGQPYNSKTEFIQEAIREKIKRDAT
jgi:metal-responsive CopG/Arc/MetJ family transcriptional regulator